MGLRFDRKPYACGKCEGRGAGSGRYHRSVEITESETGGDRHPAVGPR